jgi:hypothetical protein
MMVKKCRDRECKKSAPDRRFGPVLILTSGARSASKTAIRGHCIVTFPLHEVGFFPRRINRGGRKRESKGGIEMVRMPMIVALIVAAIVSPAAAKYVDVRDPARRARVVASLRERGQDGLNVALRAYDSLQKQQAVLQQAILRYEADGSIDKASYGKNPKAAHEDRLASTRRQLDGITAQLEAWRTAIDEIGSQRGCAVSRLYWHTDIGDARAAAERTGRPILSLRMLGKLTDEYSCANSRFFRTALYSNAEVSQFLRDNYVLHWQSVRPVPRVTIDFGDGRKLERTLTGNSAHYILTSSGKPLDVLPGLYAPQAFTRWLQRMHAFHGKYLAAQPDACDELLANFHREQRTRIYRQWADDIESLGESEATLVVSRIDQAIARAGKAGRDHPLAAAAARIAVAKSAAETPLLRYANYGGPWIDAGMDDDLWRAIAARHRDSVKLDDASVTMMRAEFPRAAEAGQQAESKRRQEDPLLRVVRSFEDSMTLDTVRNEYLLNRRIHDLFADAPNETQNVDVLNEWVYATLFLTPSTDPWLGLAPSDVYTALENDGRTEPGATMVSRSSR